MDSVCYISVCLLIFFTTVLVEPQTTAVNNEKVPYEFPKNESQYNFVDNSTIRENLSHSNIDTEVEDLINTNQGPYNNKVNSSIQISSEDKEFIKDDTEYIQTRGSEDDRNLSKVNISEQQQEVPLVQGQLAAILAGIFLMIAVVGYVGLLSWRRFLENRYGNRDMLVNEDEFNDPNDMRHFSL